MTSELWLGQEQQFMESVLLPFLEPLPSDVDSDLRCQAVQVLVHLIPSASARHASSLLAILSQVGLWVWL